MLALLVYGQTKQPIHKALIFSKRCQLLLAYLEDSDCQVGDVHPLAAIYFQLFQLSFLGLIYTPSDYWGDVGNINPHGLLVIVFLYCYANSLSESHVYLNTH